MLENNERPSAEKALVLSGGGARGAYQAGVYRYLSERGWRPDLICGTSVGAINACAIASGMDVETLDGFWRHIAYKNIYVYSIWKKIWRWIFNRGFTPVFDTAPLRKLLGTNLNLNHLKKSDVEVVICAINIVRSKLRFFTNDEITIDHIMASSAIPLLFPWQDIDGQPHWDGGLMENTPLLPALEREAKDIIVVLLSPVGEYDMPVPTSRKKAAELMLEQSLVASYQSFIEGIEFDENLHQRLREQGPLGYLQSLIRPRVIPGDTRILTVAPKKMLGISSMMNFSPRQSEELLNLGYEDAKEQLGTYIQVVQ